MSTSSHAARVVATCLLAFSGTCMGYLEKQKYQVLMPQPQSHTSGSDVVMFGAVGLQAIVDEAKVAGPETVNIVNAQLMARLPQLMNIVRGDLQLKVKFLHSVPSWNGHASWQPIRQRNESYGLSLRDSTLTIDAQSSWGLSNAMATLYQLFAVKKAPSPEGPPGKLLQVSIPGCPHEIKDHPSFPHRGLLLDVARTFYPVSFLQDLIVNLGEFKLNILHLHLTDTAAWPLEVDMYPELAKKLSYKDNNDEALTYSRVEVKDLVEFARLRGVSVLPEVDGPAHAPALAGTTMRLTVAASADFSTDDFAVEPPPGTWNYSDASVTSMLADVFRQLETDFTTTPYLHVGGDEPRASSLCEALTDKTLKAQCAKECTSRGGGSPYAPNCATLAKKPEGADGTYWFPEVLNSKIQKYFDEIVPEEAKMPVVAWSGTRADMGVTLPKPVGAPSKPVLQLWEFPTSGAPLSVDDCKNYDFIQSSATHPQGADGKDNAGWMYLECGEGQNWISMAQNYWCSRASWVSMYSQNLTQHYEETMATPECQSAFVGAEIGIWGEITGAGNTMSLIFPRAVAFAERAWTNPRALSWKDLAPNGAPPGWYWDAHVKGALARLNTVVENFDIRGVGVTRLQPKFCHDHPEYCTNYTKPFMHVSKPKQRPSQLI